MIHYRSYNQTNLPYETVLEAEVDDGTIIRVLTFRAGKVRIGGDGVTIELAVVPLDALERFVSLAKGRLVAASRGQNEC